MKIIQIIGNLTRGPVQREVGQYKVTDFTVAANGRKVKGEADTTFYKVNAWGALGDICLSWLSKGKQVYVHGEPRTRTYENAEGKTVVSEEIRADEVLFLGGRSEDAAQDQPKPKAKKNYTEKDFTDIQSEDIPF